jgi:hypothetical protein
MAAISIQTKYFIWLAAVLAILLACFFGPVVSGGKVLFYRDVLTFHYPIWAGTAGDFHASGLPFWNPRFHFGQPILGNPNFMLCYPPAWIRFAMDPVASYHLFVLGHLLAGGLAFFLLVRSWNLSPAAGLWGAVLYTFSGVNLSLTCVLNLIPYVALIPAAMWALENLVRTRRIRWASALSLFLALIVTVFEPMMVAALALIFLLQLGVALGTGAGGSLRLAVPGLMLLAAVLAALLAAPMLWEGVQLARSAHRTESSGMDATLYSQHPLLSLEMFLPNPLGFSFEDKRLFRGSRFLGDRDPYLVSVYLGLGLLPLAGLGFSPPWSRRTLLLLGGFLVFLLLSWGDHLPGLVWLTHRLPLLSWARYPQKFMIPASLLLVLLGTSGWHRLFEAPSAGSPLPWKKCGWIVLPVLAVLGISLLIPEFSLRSLLPLGVAALAAVTGSAVAGWRRPAARRWACHLAGCLLAADLALANGFAVPLAPAAALRGPVPLLSSIHRPGVTPGSCRVAVEPHPASVPGAGADALWYMLFLKHAGYPYFGITQDTLYAFDLMLDKTQTLEMSILRDEYFRRPLDQRVALMKRLGVQFLISRSNYAHPGLAVVHAEPLAPGCVFKVYRVAGARGRLAFYPSAAAETPADPGAAIDRLVSLPPDQVLLNDAVLPRAASPPRPDGLPGPSTMSSVGYESDCVTATVSSQAPGVLVLRDCLTAGWTALVDGRPAPVRRVDAFFMGVALPPGDHRVEFRYRPTFPPWLYLLSLAVGLCLIAGLLSGRRVGGGLSDRQPDHDGR